MFEPWQLAAVCIGAFLVGLSKTGIAGLGILSVAIFASILPTRESVGVVLVILLSADFVAVTAYRRDASWPHLLRLFPWAACGVAIGALAMGRIDDLAVRRLIGGTLLALSALHALRRRAPADAPPPAIRGWAVGLTGLLAGFTTMIANAAGPIMIIYLLGMRLPKLQFIGTAAWFFLVLNLFKVPFSYSLGLINPASLTISLWLAPFAIVGALSGRVLIRHINQRLFERLALILTLLAGLRLLVA